MRISVQKTTLVLTTGLIPFSVVLFSLTLAAFASILQGNPSLSHALVFTLTLFGTITSALFLQRLKYSFAFTEIFFLKVMLIGLYLGALPLLYYYSPLPIVELVLTIVFSLWLGLLLGAQLIALSHQESPYSIAIASGIFLAIFCGALWFTGDLGYYLLSTLIGLLNALLLLGLVFCFPSEVPLKRWLWIFLSSAVVIGTIIVLVFSNQIQKLLEYTLYHIYPVS